MEKNYKMVFVFNFNTWMNFGTGETKVDGKVSK